MPKSQSAVAEPEVALETAEEIDFESDGLEVEEEIEETSEQSPFGIWSAETAKAKPLKVLLYGPSGAGKTRYAATFPDPLFLDLEGGLRSTIGVKPVLRYPSDPSREVTDMAQVGEFYKQVLSYSPDKAPFKTVVVDSLNELQVLVTKRVLGTYQSTRQMDDQLTFQDYGKIGRDVLNIVGKFLKLPYNVVFTAVETPREYEGQEVHPKFAGKMIWPELQRWMEQIGYVHVVKGEQGKMRHVVSYELHPSYVAKTRLHIPERLLDNNYEALAQYIPQQ